MYYLILYFICMFYQVYYLLKNDLLCYYPSFLLFCIPIVIVCYTSLFLGRYSFVLQYTIAMLVLSILLLVISHLTTFSKNSLSHIHTRYFYIISMLIYLYVLTSLNGKNMKIGVGTTPFLSSILTIMICIFMLLILNSIDEGEKKSIPWHFLCSFRLFISTVVANVSIYFFTFYTSPFLDSRVSILLYGLPLLIPYFMRMKHTITKKRYQIMFSTGFGIMIFLFFLLSTIYFITPTIPILYYYDIFIHRGIQIGLYATVLLLLPSMKKLPCPFFYHLLAFIIMILCSLLFW